MLDAGFTSGCLTVISNDFDLNHQNILKSFYSLAEEEWNKFDQWNLPQWPFELKHKKFEDYFKLSKLELQAFIYRQSMPNSFVEKYCNAKFEKDSWNIFSQSDVFLYHKRNPNTVIDIVDGYFQQELYEVECSICHNHFFMDEKSICCVEWRNCSGAECLSHTVTDKICTYDNLCTVSNDSTALQTINMQFGYIENLVQPLSYYGGDPNLHISYISDIHFFHHLKRGISLSSLILSTVKRLYKTMDDNGIIVFAGDISSDMGVTIDFFRKFVKYNDFLEFSKTKKILLKCKNKMESLDCKIIRLNDKKCKLLNKIEPLKMEISKFLDFDSVIQYKNRYRENTSWVKAVGAYELVESYISKGISEYCNPILEKIARLFDFYEKNLYKYDALVIERDKLNQSIKKFESKFGKPFGDLKIADVYTVHHFLSDNRRIFFVLGNHEYIGFQSVNSAIIDYQRMLGELGIELLQNNFVEFDSQDKRCVIFGGTGFAKYNIKYNADNLVCCDNFTRDDEVKETTAFERAYANAKKYAKANNSCFICVSHYPIYSCFNHIDNDTIYFYGHNHQNYYHRNEDEMIYADNQIGYDNPNIEFKTMKTGLDLNPYFELGDGLYETTIKDYLKFYRHVGEYIGDGSLLYQRCQNDKASIYVNKRKGYYGFFVMNPKKGISIVDGGKTKKITKSVDLQWLFNNFEVVLSKYLKALVPLRLLQERISKELKELGFSGAIHGCIIDIDFYHHVMVNPADGKMKFYYSPYNGELQLLSSFDEVLLSIKKKNAELYVSDIDYDSIRLQFLNLKKDPECLLGKTNELCLFETEDNNDKVELSIEEHDVPIRSDIMYNLSRKISPFQRLFSGRILRGFDLRLAESQPQIERRTKSIKGNNSVMKCGMNALVIEDNGVRDITVRFDNGIIVEHCTRKQFLNGTIHPKLISEPKPKPRSLNGGVQTIFNGLKIENEVDGICECRCGCNTKFTASKSEIVNSIITSCGCGIKEYRSYVGCTKKMKCGMFATVIEDYGCKNVTVKFQNGIVRTNIRKDHFREGKVSLR